jgi:S1-C subfamily serine protease
LTKKPKEFLDRVKSATVAVAVLHEDIRPIPEGAQPFTILGSGFCLHSMGVIATCTHVIEAFMEKSIKENIDSIPEEDKSENIQRIPDTRSLVPHALFYSTRPVQQTVHVVVSRVDVSIAKTNMDIGLLRLHPHAAYPQGYPIIDLEDIEEIHEGMEIATCGFPMGNMLFNQLGTVTSSFSRGIISSIIPAAGVDREHLKGYQLDLRATHGNSGGPVFSWASGRVIGILQGGVNDEYGNHLFSRAESVYRLLDLGIVDRILKVQNPNKCDS